MNFKDSQGYPIKQMINEKKHYSEVIASIFIPTHNKQS